MPSSTDSANRVVVRAGTELDLDSAPALAMQLAAACAQHPALLVVDLTGNEFCDSLGLDALMLAADRQRASGGHLTIRNPPRPVRRLIDLLGLTTVLPEEGSAAQPG